LKAHVYLLQDDLREVPFPVDSSSVRGVKGTVKILAQLPHRIDLDIATEENSFLAASELWFPAWEAYVDGKPVPMLKAYGTFWAVPILKGPHSVSFVFQDRVSFFGRWISIFSCAGLILYLGIHWFAGRRKGNGADLEA
jgi:hypothetical protein